MLLGVLSVLCSASKTIGEAGFYEYNLKPKDYLFIDLSKGLTAFVLKPDPVDYTQLMIHSVNETGSGFDHILSSSESTPLYGVKCMGGAANITTNGSITVTVWVLPKTDCDGPAIAYSSPSFISDVFVSESAAKNFCMFFPSQGGAHFYVKQVQKSSEVPSKFMISKKDLTFITTDEFHDNLSSPFFVKFPKLNEKDEIRMDVTYATNIEDRLCGSDFIVSVDGPIKGYAGLKTSKRYTTCDVTHYGEEAQFIIITLVFVIILAVLVFFYFNGMCSSMTSSFRRLVGPAAPPSGVDVAVNEEYMNETSNIVMDIEEDEAEL